MRHLKKKPYYKARRILIYKYRTGENKKTFREIADIFSICIENVRDIFYKIENMKRRRERGFLMFEAEVESSSDFVLWGRILIYDIIFHIEELLFSSKYK